eukprot:5859400-Alexandrium_andersonii.AAC.1
MKKFCAWMNGTRSGLVRLDHRGCALVACPLRRPRLRLLCPRLSCSQGSMRLPAIAEDCFRFCAH